uniref:Uncharacterized protein n=1 Tax=Arundo donax TaxID=35708 RepID=A0A0A8YQ04_ARUDO
MYVILAMLRSGLALVILAATACATAWINPLAPLSKSSLLTPLSKPAQYFNKAHAWKIISLGSLISFFSQNMLYFGLSNTSHRNGYITHGRQGSKRPTSCCSILISV